MRRGAEAGHQRDTSGVHQPGGIPARHEEAWESRGAGPRQPTTSRGRERGRSERCP